MIEFPNNFEGEKADKSLTTKLQTPEELSGFLNLVLAGLKRLRDNGKFSNEKSIEATQKEYELNGNPIAAFMDERTQTSDEDCDATILYLEYVNWCRSRGKDHMKNIGFSRKLINMSHTSHRENTIRNNSIKKITMWDTLKIKIDKIEQVKTGYECAKNLSCPNIRFSDSNSHRTGCKDDMENYLVQEQKVINSEQSDEDNFVKKNKNLSLYRTDLKNLVRRN